MQAPEAGSLKKLQAKRYILAQNDLHAIQEDPYNFWLGSFVDVAVRQYALPSRQDDLKVR